MNQFLVPLAIFSAVVMFEAPANADHRPRYVRRWNTVVPRPIAPTVTVRTPAVSVDVVPGVPAVAVDAQPVQPATVYYGYSQSYVTPAPQVYYYGPSRVYSSGSVRVAPVRRGLFGWRVR